MSTSNDRRPAGSSRRLRRSTSSDTVPSKSLSARSRRNPSRSSTPSPGGRCESHPFPALSDRCTCRRRSPNSRRTSIRSWLATAACEVSSTRLRHPGELIQILVRVEHQRPRADVHGEHVLHRDRDPGARLDLGKGCEEPPSICPLPSVGRVHHDQRDLRRGRDPGRRVDLADRVLPPHGSGEQERGGVQRADLQAVLGGEVAHHRGALARAVLRDHHLDPRVAALGGQLEGRGERPGEERCGGQQQTGRGHGPKG